MRIQLNDVRDMSLCPAYYNQLKGIESRPRTFEVVVAEQVMQRAYLTSSQTGFKIPWKRVVSLVDTFIFQSVDVGNEKQFEAARSDSERVLNSLHPWYYKHYLEQQLVGYANIPLQASLGSDIILGTAPMIIVSDMPIIVYIDDVATLQTEMYNDIKVRGLLWLVSEYLDSDIVAAQHIEMKLRGEIEINTIEVKRHKHVGTKKAISQVAAMIKANVDYPSRTRMCDSCSFKRRCRI